MTNKKTVYDIDISGKTVLVRVDYNVPFKPNTTEISDDSRIEMSLPTIRYLVQERCKIILCSHLGRPRGKFDKTLQMLPISQRLSEILEVPIIQAQDCIGPSVSEAVYNMAPGEIMFLENLRFHSGEEENDSNFSASLVGNMIDIFVNDAFGAAHRAHASIEGVTHFLPSVAGLLMTQELEMLGTILDNPQKPFLGIIGGSKVSDKIGILHNLTKKVDTLIIGGGMAATFLKASGLEIGTSSIEKDQVFEAEKLLRSAQDTGLNILLPEDVITADTFSSEAKDKIFPVSKIPSKSVIMDIGPETILSFEKSIHKAKTVLWNGPMGVFEWNQFASGTSSIARAIAGLTKSMTVIGGGSTAEAVRKFGFANQMTHISTGGGASMEFLEGINLPGVFALMDK